MTVVPTHALELVEAAAAREAAAERAIEAREPCAARWTSLAQHLVTCALGGGFRPREMLAEMRGTHAYAQLTDGEWQWALDFVVHGGVSLNAYPEYRRVVIGDDGIARVPDARIARRHRRDRHHRQRCDDHRADRTAALGHVEETFIARLSPGDTFVSRDACWNSSACAR